jgi:hypothetical protein
MSKKLPNSEVNDMNSNFELFSKQLTQITQQQSLNNSRFEKLARLVEFLVNEKRITSTVNDLEEVIQIKDEDEKKGINLVKSENI